MIPPFFIFLFIAGADESVWVEDREVPIYYEDFIGGDVKGYYDPNKDEIHLLESAMYQWALPGCSIRDHEIFHAWGYDHVSMSIFNCINPNTPDSNYLQYSEDNLKHRNPEYDIKHREPNPLMERWK